MGCNKVKFLDLLKTNYCEFINGLGDLSYLGTCSSSEGFRVGSRNELAIMWSKLQKRDIDRLHVCLTVHK